MPSWSGIERHQHVHEWEVWGSVGGRTHECAHTFHIAVSLFGCFFSTEPCSRVGVGSVRRPVLHSPLLPALVQPKVSRSGGQQKQRAAGPNLRMVKPILRNFLNLVPDGWCRVTKRRYALATFSPTVAATATATAPTGPTSFIRGVLLHSLVSSRRMFWFQSDRTTASRGIIIGTFYICFSLLDREDTLMQGD